MKILILGGDGFCGWPTALHLFIQDTVRCIRTTLENPPPLGDRAQIVNQMTETRRVRDLTNDSRSHQPFDGNRGKLTWQILKPF